MGDGFAKSYNPLLKGGVVPKPRQCIGIGYFAIEVGFEIAADKVDGDILLCFLCKLFSNLHTSFFSNL